MRLLSFFFQAEDGIRDLTVTGVQTCALPIYRQRGGPRRRLHENRTGCVVVMMQRKGSEVMARHSLIREDADHGWGVVGRTYCRRFHAPHQGIANGREAPRTPDETWGVGAECSRTARPRHWQRWRGSLITRSRPAGFRAERWFAAETRILTRGRDPEHQWSWTGQGGGIARGTRTGATLGR